jgi:hypothetical protein
VGVSLALVLGLHLLVLPQVFVAVPLRADSDTAVMLDAMRASGGLSGAGRWFVGDWFLENGFYRPITCLSLVLDYTLYGERAWGYRLTNWLLMVATALGLMGAVRAFARQIGFPLADALASLSALMFSLQQTGLTALFDGWSDWWFVMGLVLITLMIRFAPPSCRWLPLCEGNRIEWVPQARRRNLKERVFKCSQGRGDGNGCWRWAPCYGDSIA